MKIELLNQYRRIVDLEEYGKKEKVYRTKKMLDDLKANLDPIDSLGKDDCEWKYEGSGMFVYARVLNTQDINKIRTFHKHNSDLGETGFYTIEELKNYNCVWVKGYGFVEDYADLKKAYENAATKK